MQEIKEVYMQEVIDKFVLNYPDGDFKNFIINTISGQMKFLYLVMLDNYKESDQFKLINNPDDIDVAYNYFLTIFQRFTSVSNIETENIQED
ncbi:MAG: hypothetical protein PHC28_09265 [Flavobacterium sp.]|uniref:hypothetical protein n=1 Tax=Flavobacterium sp. TaxID=239 RepID=UPI002633F52A|nr:hypothetical protein [Flavobacterium sp.]MDD5150658.1 hypothetical protein [Flavobacterium sp.]